MAEVTTGNPRGIVLGLPRWRRWLRAAGWAGLASLAAFPPVALDCERPALRAEAPDRSGQAVVVCPRPARLAGASAASEAGGPGWATIRDARGRVAGAVDVDPETFAALAASAPEPRWTEAAVALPRSAEFARPSEVSAPLAWLRDRFWRWRALLGFVAPSEAFR